MKPTKFRRLLEYLHRLFSKKLPQDISQNEMILRAVYSPMNIGKNGGYRENLFKTPENLDEVSVNRLSYTTPNFCKGLSKKHQNKERNRTYFGFAILTHGEILGCDCNTVYSPIYIPLAKRNIYHSDIKIGFVREVGKELPSEFTYKVNQLAKASRKYIDPQPENELWTGPELK